MKASKKANPHNAANVSRAGAGGKSRKHQIAAVLGAAAIPSVKDPVPGRSASGLQTYVQDRDCLGVAIPGVSLADVWRAGA